jgi:hypothetical protein
LACAVTATTIADVRIGTLVFATVGTDLKKEWLNTAVGCLRITPAAALFDTRDAPWPDVRRARPLYLRNPNARN